jgi:molybdate-binding protein/transcriptional regulator with XRE-family HTH domain
VRLASRLREKRQQVGWSQQEVAHRSGLSRALVSAVENGRGVPSAAAALALARAFGTRVEELFTLAEGAARPEWAWPPTEPSVRHWRASVGESELLYPCEPLGAGAVPHDGVADSESTRTERARATLVIAGCDPAVGLLASALRDRGVRVLAFTRASNRALELLKSGLVHVAGVHLGANQRLVRRRLGSSAKLLRLAVWEEGLALAAGAARPRMAPPALGKLRWVGRERGSGARECIDELLQGRRPEGYDRVAADHREVACIIRGGWADAGVCVRLAAAEAGLDFTSIRREAYDLCFRDELEDDPRLATLIEVVRSPDFRRMLAELPGYDARETGSIVAA